MLCCAVFAVLWCGALLGGAVDYDIKNAIKNLVWCASFFAMVARITLI